MDVAGRMHTFRVPEKAKTGFQNKVAMLVGLSLCGEVEELRKQLNSLASFVPIQSQLAEIVAAHRQYGLEGFTMLGYLPQPGGRMPP